MNREKTFIIAEAGVNHNGSLEIAKQLVRKAVEAGADAVKFQTFKSEKVISRYAEKAEYQKETTGSEESQLDMVRKLELSEEAHFELQKYCKEQGILFLSTAFDSDSMDFLVEQMNLPLLKIPSGEITNAPLLLKASQTGLPVILSTGMATLGEIEDALGVLAFGYISDKKTQPSKASFQDALFSEQGQRALLNKVTLLHCTTEYPTPFHDVNLRAMETLQTAFGLPVGLSDHTEGIAIPIAAVSLGAKVIEKHFTLDKTLPGPDHKASLEPSELNMMVRSIREVERALGSPQKRPVMSERKNINIARKSLVAAKEIRAGEFFTEENVTTKRPGNGISPMYYWDIIGTVAKQDYREDEVIMINGNRL